MAPVSQSTLIFVIVSILFMKGHQNQDNSFKRKLGIRHQAERVDLEWDVKT